MSKVSERDLWEMNVIESFSFPIEFKNKWIEYKNQLIKNWEDSGFPSIDSIREGEYQHLEKLWKDRILRGTKGEMRENGKELIKDYIELLWERDKLVDILNLISGVLRVNNESLRTQKN